MGQRKITLKYRIVQDEVAHVTVFRCFLFLKKDRKPALS